MKESVTEKKTQCQPCTRTKSVQNSGGYKQEVGLDFVGLGYHQPERFVPLLARFAHPANAAQRTQLFFQLQRQYGNRYVQRVVSAQRSRDTGEDESKVASEILSKKGSGRALEPGVRAFMEPRFGYDFSNVRVHTDSFAATTSNELNAEAFTIGGDIFFNSGRYDPSTTVGKKLPAHELVHSIQQRRGEELSTSIVQKADNESHPYCSPEPAMRALEVAYNEYEKGVVEDPPCTNRGSDVDNYTGVSGPPPVIRGNRRISGTCGRAWCAYFVKWSLDQAGVSNGLTPAARSVRTWGRSRGWYYDINAVNPVSGDIFYKAPDDTPSTHPCDTNPCVNRGPGTGHVGFVLSVSGNTVTTIEGNVHISNVNDGVGSKTRSTSELDGVLRIQPKSAYYDSYEREANRIAESVMKMENPRIARTQEVGNGTPLQRHEGEEQRAQSRVIEMPELVITAVACPCDPATNVTYDSRTYQFLQGIKQYILPISRGRGVPEDAVAGAIADEYNTRRGLKAVVDALQDSIIDALPESFIDVDRFFDIHSKLLNTLENDVGPANIKVRTALELVQRGELAVPGSPPSDIQVREIVNFLLTERGTVEAAAAVIRRAQSLFGPHTREHSEALAEAVYVEYFKQGESYYRRFRTALRSNPNHKVCPGDGGCRYYNNREQIHATIHS